MKKELIKRLEIRKQQLLYGGSYPLHSGHHLRDVMTILAYLKEEPSIKTLIKHLPEAV